MKKGTILAYIDNRNINHQIMEQMLVIDQLKNQKLEVDVKALAEKDVYKTNKETLIGQLNQLSADQNNGNINKEEQLKLQQIIVNQSKKTLESGNVELSNNKTLYKNGIISKGDLKTIEDQVLGYQSAYDQAVQQLEAIKTTGIPTNKSDDYYTATKNSINSQIAGIDKSLLRDTTSATKNYYDLQIAAANETIDDLKKQLENYIVVSPADGVIIDSPLSITNVANTAQVAFVIKEATNTNSTVDVFVSTRDIESVDVGEKVILIADKRSGNVNINGIVKKIGTEAVAKTSALGIEERDVLVEVEPEKNDFLKSGYNVDVKFIVHSETNKIIVPDNSLYKKDNKDYVMTIVNGKVSEAPVTVGFELVGEHVIDKGLKEGEVIITDLNTKGLKLGAKAVSS